MGRGTKQGLAGFKTLFLLFFFSGYSYICILFRAKKELLQWWTFLAHANFYVGSIFLGRPAAKRLGKPAAEPKVPGSNPG